MLTSLDPEGVGITRAAVRGIRSTYRYSGPEGLASLSNTFSVTSPTPAAFQARLVSVPLAEIAVEDLVVAVPCTLSRSLPTMPDRPVPDLIRVTHVVQGGAVMRTKSGIAHFVSGDVFVTSTSMVFDLELAGPAQYTTLVAPRRLMGLRHREDDRLELAPTPDSPVTRSFKALIREVVASSPDDNTIDAEHLAKALTDLMRAVALQRSPTAGRDLSTEELRRQVLKLIDENYSDPGLQRAVVAARLRISVSRLHKIFADQPFSVSQLIRRRRVREITRRLRGSTALFEDLALEVGFGSSDSAYRSFKALMHTTPSDYRRRNSL
ncbi:helix-turn-helix domain-containing protein [Microbacterium arborescens]|uniref:helix-turn-helix domain-containing protein n=1 Tax=Microbacterium arborescens TaxID=33883 RepID=UPI0027D8D5D1|nr:helix-turn-helix domain-containing protein [Microbacterium arborescens]